MAFYGGFEQEESFDTKIYKMIGTHHEDGVTFDAFMSAHKDQFSDSNLVQAALNRLIAEERVFRIESRDGLGRLHTAKLYANMIPAD